RDARHAHGTRWVRTTARGPRQRRAQRRADAHADRRGAPALCRLLRIPAGGQRDVRGEEGLRRARAAADRVTAATTPRSERDHTYRSRNPRAPRTEVWASARCFSRNAVAPSTSPRSSSITSWVWVSAW